MLMTEEPPTRSIQQRMAALSQANYIRTYRAKLKKDIKAGRTDVITVLENPPEDVQTMKVVELLMSAPKIGQVKVNRIVSHCRISPSKTVGGLTDRQRGGDRRLLASLLKTWWLMPSRSRPALLISGSPIPSLPCHGPNSDRRMLVTRDR